MDPTIILGKNWTDPLKLTTDWIPEVLTGNPHFGPCHADHRGHLVVQLECPVVNIDLIKSEVVGKSPPLAAKAWYAKSEPGEAVKMQVD